MDRNNRSYTKRRRRRNPLFFPLSFIIICVALVLGISVFFRVSIIEVTGTSIYTSEEIIEASAIEVGDNLFFLNRFSAISRIYSKLPYVEEVSVTRSMPNKVIIEVSESSAIGYVNVSGTLWGIDRNCKLLDVIKSSETSGLIEIEGIEPILPSSGETISAGESEASKVSYLADILMAISLQNMQDNVASLDISNVANPEFEYLGRFTVRLGKSEDTEYKINLLLSAIDQLGTNETGVFDLSVDKKAHFSPD